MSPLQTPPSKLEITLRLYALDLYMFLGYFSVILSKKKKVKVNKKVV